MDAEPLLRFLHVAGATVLLGTGAGITFFMLMAHRTGNAATIAAVARMVVLADMLFTATAVVAQPVTGLWLAHVTGWSLREGWLMLAIGLYILTGFFWLPVVWIQMQIKTLAEQAVKTGEPLPPRYFRLFTIWLLCGGPAFAAVLAILWLMVNRPV